LTTQEKCSQCNATLTGADKYCPECGNKIDWGKKGSDDLYNFFSKKENLPQKKTRGGKFVCDFCGYSNSKNASYCEGCGAILSVAHSADADIAEEVELLFNQPQVKQAEPKLPEEISLQKQKTVFNEKHQEQKIEAPKISSEVEEKIPSYTFEHKSEKKPTYIPHEKPKVVEESVIKEQVNVKTRKKIDLWKIYLAFVVLFLFALLFFTFYSEKKAVVPQTQQQSEPELQHLQQLEEEMKAHPNDAEAVLHYANALHDARMFPRAIEQYINYLSMNPKNADALVDLGICYFETNNATTAITNMKKAIAIQPKHQKAHFNIGIISLNIGDMNTAKDYFQKAAQLDENSETGKRANEFLQTHFK